MGITTRRLKCGSIIFLVQKRVNGYRESRTFSEKEEAEEWLKKKTEENRIAITTPSVYEADLKKLDKKVKEKPKKVFEEEVDLLEIFRKDSDKLENKDFISVFNVIPDYEIKVLERERYKNLIKKRRQRNE